MTKILITGSKSFVGTNFRKYSRFKDTDEISLISNRPEDIEFQKYDIVLHLAALVHQDKKVAESEYFSVNRDLCLRVAEESKKAGIKQFIFLSTFKVYGDFVNSSDPRNEYSECYPEDPYGKSKHAAELDLKALEDSKFTISIIRTPVVYGEGVRANMINLIKLVDFSPVLPFGNIENKRNFTFAENLVGFIDRIIEKNASGVFIAMDEKAISTTEIVNYISKSIGKRVWMFKLPQILFRIGCVFIPGTLERLYGSSEFDNSSTKEILNFSPPFSTEEGIKKTVKFYLDSKIK